MYRAYDNLSTALLLGYSPGDEALTIPASWRPDVAPTDDDPILLTVARPGAIDAFGRVLDVEGLTIFAVTGRSGGTLTAVPLGGQTDQVFPAGSRVLGQFVAEHVNQMIAALEAGAVLPDPTGHAGQYLKTDGTANAWAAVLVADVTGLQAGLDAKANVVHAHAIADVTGLQAALDGKAASTHTHAMADVTGLVSGLAGKAATVHTHVIADTTGLQTALDGKAAASHTHAASQVTDFSTAADARITAQKGTANGLATLGADSKIPAAQLPALAITEFLGTVANQAAMLALTAQRGDWCIRSDTNDEYILTSDSPANVADWKQMVKPYSPVSSVDGLTGVVSLSGVYVSLGGSYSNPTWITALAGSKVTGNIPGNAANVTGTVALGNGGTGGTDAATARTNLGVPAKVATTTDNALVRSDGTSGQQQGTGIIVGDNNEISGYLGTINEQTGTSYTLQASDVGKVVHLNNASAVALTVPNSLPAGFGCTILQKGAGQVTVSVQAGGTLRNAENKTANQWALATIYVESNAGSAASVVIGGNVVA